MKRGITRYAADRDGMICLLLDLRGQARERTLEVWSYSKRKVVHLPRLLIKIETENAKRWAAVSVPRWLANDRGLYGKPDLPPVMSEFTREHCTDMRTPQMIRDEGERALAEYVVSQQNRYRRLPGQRLHNVKADRFNGSIFQ